MGHQQFAPIGRKTIHAPQQIGLEQFGIKAMVARAQHRRLEGPGFRLTRGPDRLKIAPRVKAPQKRTIQGFAGDNGGGILRRLARFFRGSPAAIGSSESPSEAAQPTRASTPAKPAAPRTRLARREIRAAGASTNPSASISGLSQDRFKRPTPETSHSMQEKGLTTRSYLLFIWTVS